MKTYHVRRKGEDDYLQHWSLKGAHKYIAKLDLGGKFRYFYNQAEIEAYKKAKAVGGAINNAAKQVGNTAKGAYRVVRKGAQDLQKAAGREISSWKRKASKAIGLDARKDMNRKWDALGKTASGPYSKAHRNKANRWFDSRQAYEKTPLGRLESAKNRAVENAQQAWYGIEKKAGALGKDASKAASDAYRVVRKAADDVGKNVNNTIKGAQKAYEGYQTFRKLPDSMKNLAVKAGVKGASTAQKIYNVEQAIRNAPKNAQKAVSDAANEAGKTVGRTVKVARKVAGDVQKNVNNTINGARKVANDVGRNVSNAANDAVKSARKVANDVGRNVSNAANEAGRAVGKTVNRVEKAVGITDRNIAKKANQSYENTRNKYGDISKNTKTAKKVASSSQARYDKTLLGRAEKTAKPVTDLISNLTSSKPKTTSNYTNRPHQRKPKVAEGTAAIDKKGQTNTGGLMSSIRSHKAQQAKTLKASGKTYAQIAKLLGVSESQVASLLK